ncbi:MAG: HAD-IA family hydrolase [Actinomycetales bacterium]
MTSLATLTDRTFDAVLFDMDGTLINSIPVVERSWLQWAQEFGVDPYQLHGLHGIPAKGVISRLLPQQRWDEAIARICELEENDTEGIVVLPGALDALTGLPPGRAAIATSCTRELARVRIAATGLPVPTVVVTAEQTEVGKPAPDPYLLAARLLGVDPTRCLVVEDATGGVQAGRAAGCATLAVLTHLTPGSSGADAEVADLAAVSFVVNAEGVRLRPAGGAR